MLVLSVPGIKHGVSPCGCRLLTSSYCHAYRFEGKTYKLKVKPGADGLAEFQNQVRQLLGFDITDDFDVSAELMPHQCLLQHVSAY